MSVFAAGQTLTGAYVAAHRPLPMFFRPKRKAHVQKLFVYPLNCPQFVMSKAIKIKHYYIRFSFFKPLDAKLFL